MPTLHQLRHLAERNPAPLLIEPDVEDKVFTHKSLLSLPAHVQMREEEPADWERFAFLGDQVLSMCTTDVIFERYPHARSSFLTNKRSLVVSNDQLAKWSQAYGFPERIRAQPSQMQLLRSSVLAQASVFEAYIGGLYVIDGPRSPETWLKPLICLVLDEADRRAREEEDDDDGDEPETEIPQNDHGAWNQSPETLEESFARLRTNAVAVVDEDDDEYAVSPRKNSEYSTPMSQQSLLRSGSNTPRAQTRGWGSAPATSVQSTPASQTGSFQHAREPARKASSSTLPSALKFRPTGGPSTVPLTATGRSTTFTLPTHYSDPLPLPTTTPNSTFSGMSPTTGNGFLALFNQLASQKHIDPAWTTSSSGPPHKPIFEARVKVKDKIGVGKASNKQAAKQIAAKDALSKLNWHLE